MFEVLCLEKGGAIWRAVGLMNRSIMNVLEINDKLQALGPANFMSKHVNPFSILLDPENLFFTVDNVGLIAVMPLNERALHCHIAFWDKRLRGREALCRNLAQFVVAITRKHLVTAIPEGNRVVLAFARRAGFEVAHEANGVVTLYFNTNYSG
jgi:hypothetical protein